MENIKERMQNIRKRPDDNVLLRYADDEGVHCVTKKEFVSDVERYMSGLCKHFGDKVEGRHIAIVAPACYEYVLALFAGELLGAVVILINPLEEKSRIQAMIENADTDLALFGRDGIAEIASEADDVKTDFENYIKALSDSFSFLVYTSGTEGVMKGAILSQRGILSAAGDVTGVFGKIASIRSDISFGSCYLMLPLYHVFGLSILFTGLAGGVVVDLCVDFRQFYRDLQLLNSEIVACPPMAIKMFVSDLKRGRKEKWGTGLKFVFSGAAALPAEAQRTIAENGYFVAFGYGMTELAGPSAINVYMQKFESVGKAAPRTEIEIRDKEIYIKNDSVMLGYYKNPEKTAEVLKDGWIATGDLGYVDADGFLFLTGRKKNLIILSSGENISPEELEDKLYTNEKIRECKVYARDEKIAVDIYAPGATEEEIRGFVGEVNSKMPMFKAISVIELKDSELPKTSTGKIKR